jgi:hypothetical protein
MKDGRPEWDEDRASALVGKYALIGLTFVDQDENVLSQVQRHGRILEADARRGSPSESWRTGSTGTGRCIACHRI